MTKNEFAKSNEPAETVVMIVEGKVNPFRNESFYSHEVPVINSESNAEEVSEAIEESKEIIDDSFLTVEDETNV